MNNLDNKQKIFVVLVIIVIACVIGYYIFLRINEPDSYYTLEEDLNVFNEVDSQKSENKIKIHITGAVKNQGIVEIEEDGRIQDAVDAAGGFTDDANIDGINLAYKLEDGLKLNIPNKNDVNFESDEDLSEVSVADSSGNSSENSVSSSSSSTFSSDSDDSSFSSSSSSLNNNSNEKKYANLDIYISSDAGENVIQSDNSHDSSSVTSKININKASQSDFESLPGIGPSIASKIISYRNENGNFKSIEDIKNVNGIGDSKFNALKDYITI